MRHSLKVGFSFGLTSGIITTLGLMIGLYSSTNSTLVVIGGILTIAIADSLSDALGIHISEESENAHTNREIWESTISTFVFKFIIAASFILPIILFSLNTAVIVSIVWGLIFLCILSYYIGKNQEIKTWHVIVEHLIIAIIVIISTYYLGMMISIYFY
jgi:vacuolar iron transporter family protein